MLRWVGTGHSSHSAKHVVFQKSYFYLHFIKIYCLFRNSRLILLLFLPRAGCVLSCFEPTLIPLTRSRVMPLFVMTLSVSCSLYFSACFPQHIYAFSAHYVTLNIFMTVSGINDSVGLSVAVWSCDDTMRVDLFPKCSGKWQGVTSVGRMIHLKESEYMYSHFRHSRADCWQQSVSVLLRNAFAIKVIFSWKLEA